jgi:hypothetical protein
MANSSKPTIKILFEAYDQGGFPLFLEIAGLIILSGGTIFDGLFNIVPNVDPVYVLGTGVLIMLAGAASWAVRVCLQYKAQKAISDCLVHLIDGAGRVATDGLHYKAALEDGMKKFPEIVGEFGKHAKFKD